MKKSSVYGLCALKAICRITTAILIGSAIIKTQLRRPSASAVVMRPSLSVVPKHCRENRLILELMKLWRDSVKASHGFLTGTDIDMLAPYVSDALADINILVIAYQAGRPVAFMGIDRRKIEMLFVAPRYFRYGIGKRLVEFAKAEYRAEYVDVNEQNPRAKAFYESMGFRVYERSETDGQGNSFPILKMKLT